MELTTQYNVDDGSFGLCSYSNSSWSTNVPTGASSVNTPAIAVYNNQVVVIWDSRDGSKLSWGTASLDLVIDESQWMKPLLLKNPDMKLGSLTLPGSHDSCTIGTFPFVQTQRLSIAEQLNIGVRALDIRLMLFNNEIIVVHGDYSATGIREILRLNDVLSIVYAWLDTHPTEGLVIQMKNDSGDEQSMADRLSDTFNDVHWRTASNAPSLREVAGHIQLLRRFYLPSNWPAGKPLGINVRDGWVDNGSSFVLTGSASPQITVEDLYNLQDPQPQDLKWTAIQYMLGLAANDTDPDHWFISYQLNHSGGAYCAPTSGDADDYPTPSRPQHRFYRSERHDDGPLSGRTPEPGTSTGVHAYPTPDSQPRRIDHSSQH